MTLLDAIEAATHSRSKRSASLRLCIAILSVFVIISSFHFFGAPRIEVGHQERVPDFEVFYLVGQLTLNGEVEKAYSFATAGKLQAAAFGIEAYLPWAYPPQYDLLVALLALLPLGPAYLLFICLTLSGYILTLKNIYTDGLVTTLIVCSIIIFITIKCGQNGFLTGTLIGLACLAFQRSSASAGVFLGLLIFKPHLAVAFAVYTIVNRRWAAVIAAIATIFLTSAASTGLLGWGIWSAFLNGIREAQFFLEHGAYPLYRMVSIYASVYTISSSALAAIAAQALTATAALVTVVVASRRLSIRQALGFTAIASLLISPYVYDYDLPVMGIGFALLLKDLVRLGSSRERLLVYGLTFLAGFWSFAQSLRLSFSAGHDTLSLGGIIIVINYAIIWRIIRRDVLGEEPSRSAEGHSPIFEHQRVLREHL